VPPYHRLVEPWIPAPASVVSARDQILARVERPDGLEWFRFFGGLDDSRVQLFDDVWPNLSMCMKESALYLVTEDMGHVLIEATATLPGFMHDWRDEPAPCGFVVFQAPMVAVPTVVGLATTPIRGLSWQPMWFRDENGPETNERFGRGWPGLAIIQWVAATDVAQGIVKIKGVEAAEKFMHEQPPLLAFACDGWPLGWAWDDERRHPLVDGEPNPERWNSGVLAAFFRIVGEEWADGGTVHPTRSERRRAVRAQQPEPGPVRVVTLRKAAQVERADPAPRDTQRRHQWVVRGHWRNQWYPSESRHAPKFIPEYVKGPDGAPLLERPTVSVLRR
jgi:hypothetical protein